MKPRALDLFCGAGGVSWGLHQAGYEVIGVDREYHPDYPFRMMVADALDCGLDLAAFDFIWASPPCQKFSRATPRTRRNDHPDLIEPTRRLLDVSGRPYCIENVPGAPIRVDLVLTGGMFDLNTYRRRHFELAGFRCPQPPVERRWGPKTRPGACTVCGGGGAKKGGQVAAWSEAMGIHWMGRRDLAEAIPPAYAEFIGRHAMASPADELAARRPAENRAVDQAGLRPAHRGGEVAA